MSQNIRSIPNMFTMFRIALIPCFIVVFYLPFKSAGLLTAIIFCIAGLTDWLDGYLARKLNQTSRFGAFLDPVADKLIVAVALVLLVGEYAAFWMTIPAAIIVSREIAISSLREWMAEMGQSRSVSVNIVGKAKTLLQIIAIIILLSQPADLSLPLVKLGVALMYVAVIITLWSMFLYLRTAWATITGNLDLTEHGKS